MVKSVRASPKGISPSATSLPRPKAKFGFICSGKSSEATAPPIISRRSELPGCGIMSGHLKSKIPFDIILPSEMLS